jgi:hypothetical protein
MRAEKLCAKVLSLSTRPGTPRASSLPMLRCSDVPMFRCRRKPARTSEHRRDRPCLGETSGSPGLIRAHTRRGGRANRNASRTSPAQRGLPAATRPSTARPCPNTEQRRPDAPNGPRDSVRYCDAAPMRHECGTKSEYLRQASPQTPPAEKPRLRPSRVHRALTGRQAPTRTPNRQSGPAGTHSEDREHRRPNSECPRLSTRSRPPVPTRTTPAKTRQTPPGSVQGAPR